jgi:rSAM/selenodomain-associated transferase 2
VVVDGGSTDATRAIAAAHGARVLVTGPGRARQMSAGARAAKGDVLVFLHADTRLGRQHLAAVEQALAEPGIGFGSFAIELDRPGVAPRLIAAAANLRTRLDRTPYGDQAVFVRRAAFEQVGGFPDVPLLEDVLLARALRAAGAGYRFLRAPRVTTSARRWERDGMVARTLRNWATRGLFELGVSPRRLASFYHGGTPPPDEPS